MCGVCGRRIEREIGIVHVCPSVCVTIIFIWAQTPIMIYEPKSVWVSFFFLLKHLIRSVFMCIIVKLNVEKELVYSSCGVSS